MAHEERQHALLSASGAHRWLYCTPSARLEEQFPDLTSDHAREGTLAHELAEIKVRHYFFTVDFGKRKFSSAVNKLKKHELWQDEMQGYTDDYLDYIKSVALSFAAQPSVALEKQVDFGVYVPGGFGTADCIMVSGTTLCIVDFKYGKGIPVSAEGNPQLSLYALGAYEAYKLLYPIDTVKMAIVQPRIADGISEWVCSVSDLLSWGEWVKERAALADKGEGSFQPGVKQCRFCRAKMLCRARSDHNVKQAFQIGELPPLITATEAGERLEALEDVGKYQKDLQEWALKECLAGNEVPGWKAVEGRGSREWADTDTALESLQKKGISASLLYETRPLTAPQVEKMLGKKEFQELAAEFVVKKAGKPALVKESDKRPAITNKITATEVFKEDIES